MELGQEWNCDSGNWDKSKIVIMKMEITTRVVF